MVDTAKGNSYFARVPCIGSALDGLFEKLCAGRHLRGVNQEAFARRAAEILGTLNAVHPFREDNGSTQREFVREPRAQERLLGRLEQNVPRRAV